MVALGSYTSDVIDITILSASVVQSNARENILSFNTLNNMKRIRHFERRPSSGS